jgi:hypothetical protein
LTQAHRPSIWRWCIPQALTVLLSAKTAPPIGLWILFSQGFSEEEKRWSSATLGTVLGYWLK